MIRTLTIGSFKAFPLAPSPQTAPIPLSPFTILIGPNGAGKSTILQAIQILGLLVHGTIREMLDAHQWEYADLPHLRSSTQGIGFSTTIALPDATVRWALGLGTRRYPGIATEHITHLTAPTEQPIVSREGRTILRISERDQHQERTTLTLPASWLSTLDPKADRKHYPTLISLAEWAKRIRAYYFLDPVALRAPSRIETDELGAHGDNLPAFLAHLGKRPADLARLVKRVKAHYPRLVDIHPRRRQGRIELEVTEKWNGEQATFNARQVSDGLLRLIAVAAMHEMREPPSVLLIDEIENGLHPRLLGGLVSMLEELTRSGRTQVIATTHSPLTLNYVSTPDAVLLVTRGKGGGVKVTPMSETRDFQSLREHFELGELWYNVGEERLVPKGKGR